MNVDEYNCKVQFENNLNECSECFHELHTEWDNLYETVIRFWDRKYDFLIEKNVIWAEIIFSTMTEKTNWYFQKFKV